MLLKCVDRSGYVQKKKPGETVLGMHFLLNKLEKRRWVRRRLGKRKRGMKTLTAVLCEGLCMASCQEKQGPSKVGNLISAESCSRKRHSSGGRGADPQPWRTPKIYSPKTPPLLPLSKASMYLHSHSLQVRTTVHPPVFSDFPGLEFRPKIFVWEASHFTLAFAYRGEGQ